MYQHNSHKSAWCRVLAVILAVSMVLIPASFPGSAKAAEPDPGANVGYHFQDDFATDKDEWFENTKGNLNLDTVTGSWTYPSNKTVLVENGKLDVRGEDNYALLSVTKDEAPQVWADHTIELTYDYGTGWTGTSGAQQGILAKVTQNEDGTFNAYYFRVSYSSGKYLSLGLREGRGVALSYGTSSVTNEITDSCKQVTELKGLITSTVPLSNANSGDGKVKIKLEFSGSTITAYMAATDGAYAKVFDYTYLNGEAPLEPGTVGLFRGSPAQENYGWTRADSIKVTDTTDPNTPIVAFNDDFADASSLTGKAYTRTELSSVTTEDVQLGWNVSNGVSVSNSISVEGSTTSGYLAMNDVNNSDYYATVTAKTDKISDITPYWTDYAVEATFYLDEDSRNNVYYGLSGRIRPSTTGSAYDYYSVRLCTNTAGNVIYVRLYKNTNKGLSVSPTTQLTSIDNISSITLSSAFQGAVHVEMEFSGNNIIVSAKTSSMSEPSVLTFSDTTDPFTCGTAGVWRTNNNAYLDDFKITLAGEETPIFEDDFVLEGEETSAEHLAAKQQYSFTDPSWTEANDKLYAVAPSGGQQYVVTDGSADWSNYTVSANVTLNSADEGDYVGLIAHASENGRYELRMTTAGLTLYSISDTAETALTTYPAAYAVGTTYALKLEITKNGYIKVSVDNTEIDLNAEETKTYLVVADGSKLAKGTAGVAVKGGAAYTDFAVSYPLIRSKEVSISLEGDIGVNFYFDLTEDVTANASAYSFRVTVPTSVGPVASDPIPVSDELLASPPGSTEAYYKVTGTVSAKSMAENVKVELLYNGETVVKAYEASVRQYADILLASAGDAEKLLIDTMLNYGAAAQIDFRHNTNNLANTGRDHTVGELAYTDLDAYKAARNISAGTLSGIAYKETTAVLQSKVSIYHYFTLEDGANPESYTVTVAGNEAQLRHKSDNLYYIAIEDIAAKDLDEAYTVTISDGSVTHTYTSSVYSYIRAVLKSEATSATMRALATTMYWYGQAANAYFAPAA